MTLIPPEDIKVTVNDPARHGGQQAGVYTGVTVEHLPTGITVTVNVGRSRRSNTAIALDAIEGAITSPNFR